MSSGPHGGEYEDGCLLGYLHHQGNELIALIMEAVKTSETSGKLTAVYTALQPIRRPSLASEQRDVQRSRQHRDIRSGCGCRHICVSWLSCLWYMRAAAVHIWFLFRVRFCLSPFHFRSVRVDVLYSFTKTKNVTRLLMFCPYATKSTHTHSDRQSHHRPDKADCNKSPTEQFERVSRCVLNALVRTNTQQWAL
jgi:hypothetical protein